MTQLACGESIFANVVLSKTYFDDNQVKTS